MNNKNMSQRFNKKKLLITQGLKMKEILNFMIQL